mgnify:CR=1 FL=1
MTPSEVVDLVTGVLDGFYRVDFTKTDVECMIVEGKDVLDHSKTLVEDIKARNWAKAGGDAAAIAQDVMDTYSKCYHVDHFEAIEQTTKKVIEFFRSDGAFKQIGAHAIANIGKIGQDGVEAYTSFEQKDFHKFGQALGDVLNLLILDGESLGKFDIDCVV